MAHCGRNLDADILFVFVGALLFYPIKFLVSEVLESVLVAARRRKSEMSVVDA